MQLHTRAILGVVPEKNGACKSDGSGVEDHHCPHFHAEGNLCDQKFQTYAIKHLSILTVSPTEHTVVRCDTHGVVAPTRHVHNFSPS